jgi:hypothetical protein
MWSEEPEGRRLAAQGRRFAGGTPAIPVVRETRTLRGGGVSPPGAGAAKSGQDARGPESAGPYRSWRCEPATSA